MIKRNSSRVAGLFVALSLMAATSTWAGFRGHYGFYGHHRSYGHGVHHGLHGYHRYHGHSHYYYPRFYGYSGGLRHGVASKYFGALDLNVKPKNTKVYLNGNYIGVTGNFDGLPRYLWLEQGTYEVIFYNNGYSTVVREFVIRPGVVIDVEQRLLPGESVPPAVLTSNASVRDGSVLTQ